MTLLRIDEETPLCERAYPHKYTNLQYNRQLGSDNRQNDNFLRIYYTIRGRSLLAGYRPGNGVLLSRILLANVIRDAPPPVILTVPLGDHILSDRSMTSSGAWATPEAAIVHCINELPDGARSPGVGDS